jgi:hypothetical protein
MLLSSKKESLKEFFFQVFLKGEASAGNEPPFV